MPSPVCTTAKVGRLTGTNRVSFFLDQHRKTKSTTMIKNFLNDENGVIVSAEIVLVATILVSAWW
jgi:hypothetical protein